MDKNQAQNLIEDTFENEFDRVKFSRFIVELLNLKSTLITDPGVTFNIDQIPNTYKPFINSFEKITDYKSNKDKLDVLVIRLNKETSVERARTMQRNFIAWYLRGDCDGEQKDAALAAFVSPDEKDWRFSLIKMDYSLGEDKKGRAKISEEFSPAKRWSFLVGLNEKSHTAQSQLLDILEEDDENITLTQLEEVFSVEKVTKEFFAKYRELFFQTKEVLDEILAKDLKIKTDFEEKNIHTTDFTKKLLGQIVFLYFLQKKGWFGVARDAEWGTGPKNFLRELFEGKHSRYNNFFNDILEPLFYEALRIDRSANDDYYDKFNCKIPFLNGGLFDPIGEYDWVHTDINLPNDLFSNSDKNKVGDSGTGILDIFDRYNFTVKEDEPLEKEIAVDPEMLGKVFENLLEIKDRKSKGTYYTPREIVHYMCQQSLINYLVNELEDKVRKEDIESLIKYGEHIGEYFNSTEEMGLDISTEISANVSLIDEKLVSIKICDPAVGSGAFLVGMMAEVVRIRNVLSGHIDGSSRSIYELKRDCIEKSLYGVDIDQGAVEICKLRLWLSLIVDEEDIKKIKPLPNLDYKIVCGNSLLEVDKQNMFIDYNLSQIEKIKLQYFSETDVKKKKEYKKKIDELIEQVTNGHKEFDFEVYFSEVFHKKKGFDITIANPPYVEHKKLKSISDLLRRFKVYSGTADLYVYFYEVALNILREKGVLTFISSNKFIRTRYGSPLRSLLAKNWIYNIVDFTKVRVFDALVASCIILVSKDKPAYNITVTFVDNNFTGNLAGYIENNYIKVPSTSLGSDMWQLEDATKLRIKERIENGSKRLESIEGMNIFRGITTGYNPAFIIDFEKCKELIEQDKANKKIIKPLLQGRNIKRWFYNKTSECLLFIPWHFPLHLDEKISGFSSEAEEAFKDNYPVLYKHLERFKKELSNRNKEETGIRYEWYALQRCAASYYPEFEKEKIIWSLTSDKWTFTLDYEGHYLPSNGYILTSSIIPIKYLLAIINSKLMELYFGFIGIMTAGGAYTLKHETIAKFPIKDIPDAEQEPFIDFVDKIFAMTKDDDYLQNPDKQVKVKDYEKQIDQLVYELYGLTPEEIEIVENSDR